MGVEKGGIRSRRRGEVLGQARPSARGANEVLVAGDNDNPVGTR